LARSFSRKSMGYPEEKKDEEGVEVVEPLMKRKENI
jgi:hypothetical protein